MTINDGGPAFPRPIGHNGGQTFAEREVSPDAEGMSLRDYFAAKAMQAEMITTFSDATPGSAEAFAKACARSKQTPEQRLAANAYGIADAMIAERERQS